MRICCIVITVLLVSANPAFACTGANIKANKTQTVKQIVTNQSHPKRYMAAASFDPVSGRPLITYYRRYIQAPSYFKRFIRHHECCHHILYRNGYSLGDEIGANCCAFRRMKLTKKTAHKIKNYMIREKINSYVAIKTDGVGAEFWSRTVARCPKTARIK